MLMRAFKVCGYEAKPAAALDAESGESSEMGASRIATLECRGWDLKCRLTHCAVEASS